MRFETSATVDAPPAAVFALTQDYARRLEWDPFLRQAELLGGASQPAVGVRARCVARGGIGMETEYVSFAPPRVTAVKMTRGPWFLESFAGTWEFSGAPEGPTEVTFRYHVRARPAWLSALIEPILVRWFALETRQRLAALRAAAQAARGAAA